MNARTLIPPILALVLLVIVGNQTSNALRQSGTWRSAPRPTKHVADPYASLERALSRSDSTPSLATLRDPFSFGHVQGPPVARVYRAPAPVLIPQPVVTAIVTDADAAHAVIVYLGTSYSVRSGDLFAQYRVVSIAPESVVLDDGRGQQLVLKGPTKGD